jgi:hypothetical protein
MMIKKIPANRKKEYFFIEVKNQKKNVELKFSRLFFM